MQDHYKKIFWIFLYLFFVCTSTFAQIRVKGQVKEANQTPITGVSVLLKGTNIVAISDINGNYTITVPSEESVLTFSFMGMSLHQVQVGKQRVINVVMTEDTKFLDDVVVVGYGTMKKSDLTGAVVSYRPNQNDAGKNISIDYMLQGKIAGLNVSSTVDAPGAASLVTIRGANSLRGDNQPLYVIDNIPQSSTGEFITSGGNGTYSIATNGLSSLNPADIESIEVLKDASATAIYGSRGANGVILVTTKRGKTGKPSVSLSFNFTTTNASHLLDMMNLEEYAQYKMIYGGGYSKDANGEWNLLKQDHDVNSPTYGQNVWNTDLMYHLEGNDVYRFNGVLTKLPEKWTKLTPVNWQNEIYGTAFSQNHSVTISGGSEKITYFTSASYKNIEGLTRGTGLTQGDFRQNLDAKISDNLKLNFSLNASLKENHMMAGGNTTGGATGAVSNVALYSAPYVRSQEEMEITTPNLADRATVWTWVDDFEDLTKEKSFRGSMDLNWKMFKFLSYNLRTGGNISIEDRSRWYNITLYDGAMQNGYLTQAQMNRSNYSIENVLQYNHAIKNLVDINVTAGVTYDLYKNLNTLTVGNNFNIYSYGINGMHMANNVEVKEPIQSDFQLLSGLGRANLSFLNGRYLMTASIRADGSSKFKQDNRWAYFPAATVAWRLEQEPFMKDIAWVNQLKLRIGYGMTGSQSIGPYSTFSFYGSTFVNSQGSTKSAQSADGNGNKLIGLAVDKMENNGLKWETTSSNNMGVDFNFFKGLIGGSVDVYSKETKDLLIQKDLPESTGFKTLTVNQGKLRNKGFEVSLKGDVIRLKNLTWSVSGNIAFNKGEILDFGLPEKDWGSGNHWKAYMGNSIGDHFGQTNIFIAGKEPGLFYGYKTDGIIQYNDPYLTKVTSSIGSLAPGNFKLVDTDQDGVVNEKDRQLIGNPNPDFTYGFQTSVTWRSLSLSIAFNGVQGRDVLNVNARYFKIPSNSTSMVYKSSFSSMWRDDNPWTGANYSNELPSNHSVTPKVALDTYVEDASYLRCNDITLSYNLEKSLVSKIGFQDVGLYVSVKNAFLITNYQGYDPEVNSFAFDGTRPGIDASSYPHTRSYLLGINVSF